MSPDRNGPTETAQTKTAQTKTAQNETAYTGTSQTETVRPNRPDRKVLFPLLHHIDLFYKLLYLFGTFKMIWPVLPNLGFRPR